MPARRPAPPRHGPAPHARTGGLPNPVRAIVDGTYELAAGLNPRRNQSELAKVAFHVTLAGLAADEVIQPEIAVLGGVGHLLASSRSKVGREAGEAIEETT